MTDGMVVAGPGWGSRQTCLGVRLGDSRVGSIHSPLLQRYKWQQFTIYNYLVLFIYLFIVYI